MISHGTESGDVVRRNDGQLGLVLCWIGENAEGKETREVSVAVRKDASEPFRRVWYPYSFFVDNFTYVGKFEA